jgi:hypothetical protein
LEGRVTKLYGGEAEPEPWAKKPPALTSANVHLFRNGGDLASADTEKAAPRRGKAAINRRNPKKNR